MDDSWPGDWMRAALTLCVLAVLAEGEAHGYAISQRLSGAGIGSIKGGTLYPLLSRLEADGQVTASWRQGEAGPGRKVFAITPRGRVALHEQAGKWLVFTERTNAVLSSAVATAKPKR